MILAIDPGNEQSAYVLMDIDYKPARFEKIDNMLMLDIVDQTEPDDEIVIEMIGHYGTGMPAGKTVFDTCIWIGRFMQQAAPVPVGLILRPTVKANICGSSRAKDANVIQALKDRFGDKGTKKDPGWFYGFRADCWQAYALSVIYLDQQKQEVAIGR